MPKKAKPLTALEVGRLSKPGLRMVGTVPGLGLQIGESGSKSWILRFKLEGRRRDMGLGGFPEITLAKALERARAARESVRAGVDPLDAAKAAQRAEIARRAASKTFAEVAEAYITAHAPSWRNAKHGAQGAGTLQAYRHPLIGEKLGGDHGPGHVQQVIAPLWTTKTETARRV